MKIFFSSLVILSGLILSSAVAKADDQELSEKPVGYLTDISVVQTAFNDHQKCVVRTDLGVFTVYALLSGVLGNEVRIHHHRHDSLFNHFEYDVLCIHDKDGVSSSCGGLSW